MEGRNPPTASIGWGEGDHNHPLPAPHEGRPHPVRGSLRPNMNFFALRTPRAGAFGPQNQPRETLPQPTHGWPGHHTRPTLGQLLDPARQSTSLVPCT